MKTVHKYYLLLLILFTLFLSACARGGVGTTTSWPGVAGDMESNVAYVAHGQRVYAVDLESGREKWRYPQETENNVTFYADPALTPDGHLIVGGYDKILHKLDTETGQEISNTNWPFTNSEDIYVAGPLVSGNYIFAPSTDGNLYILDVEGNLVNTISTDAGLWATPASDGENIYIPSMDHHLYAYNIESGEEIWPAVDMSAAITGTPALSSDGVLYVGTLGSEMTAIDAKTGKAIWNQPVETVGWVWAGPLLLNDVIYFGDLSGSVYALNVANGSEKWARAELDPTTSKKVTGTPHYFEDKLYIGSENGNLYEVDPETGASKVFWSDEKGKLYTGPVSAGDKILVAIEGGDALLVALDNDGFEVWQPFVPAE